MTEPSVRGGVWLVAFVALGVGITGCSGGDAVSRSLAQADRVNALICSQCPQVLGATSSETCHDTYEASRPTASEEACLHRVYAENAAAIDPSVDCEFRANAQFETCVRAALATCPPDPAEASACGAARTSAVEACPDVSSAVTAEIGACFE